MKKKILEIITGGSGSGKSEYAEDTAMTLKKKLNADNLVYIATMKPFGNDAEERIKRHRKLRQGKGFITVERYTDIGGTEVPKNSVVLLECMSNLVANEMFGGGASCNEIVNGVYTLLSKCEALVIVTNEVFSDGCLYDEVTLEYIKMLAEINKALAETADRMTEVIFGIPDDITKYRRCGGLK